MCIYKDFNLDRICDWMPWGSTCIAPLVNPYDIVNKWLPFHHEDAYVTYLKCHVWVTNGTLIEPEIFHKEVPYPVEMSDGSKATHWMLMKDEFSLFNVPSEESLKDLGELC